MIDKEKIPEPLLKKLFELFGEEETEKIINNTGYNYQSLVWKVEDENFKRKFGIKLSPLIFIIFLVSLFLIMLF